MKERQRETEADRQTEPKREKREHRRIDLGKERGSIFFFFFFFCGHTKAQYVLHYNQWASEADQTDTVELERRRETEKQTVTEQLNDDEDNVHEDNNVYEHSWRKRW